MARRCNDCPHCKRKGFARSGNSAQIRQKYYCMHPDRFKLPLSAFRNLDAGLIGIGEPTAESRLTIKTHPRWCPMELFKK